MSVYRVMIQGHGERHIEATGQAKWPGAGGLLKSGWGLSGMGSGQYRKAGNKWVQSRKRGISVGRKRYWCVQKLKTPQENTQIKKQMEKVPTFKYKTYLRTQN